MTPITCSYGQLWVFSEPMSTLAIEILLTVTNEAARHVGGDWYAIRVLLGARNWVGTDVPKTARYRQMRDRALFALEQAGGRVVRAENGRYVSAVRVCTDDYGHEVFATFDGFKRFHTKSQVKSI